MLLPASGALFAGAVHLALYNPKNGKRNRAWLKAQGVRLVQSAKSMLSSEASDEAADDDDTSAVPTESSVGVN
jgi:hypothetical protein